MTRYHLPLRWMSNFKAIAIDYEYYLTLGDEGRLYCLTDREIYILYSQVEAYTGWLTRWYNTEDITQKTVGFIQSDLLEALMSCVDIQVLIDQAKITASYEATSHQIQSQAVRDILTDRYDGSPTSINPSAPTTNFGSSGDRYDALCAAITAFVYKFAAEQANVIRLNEVGGAAAIALIAAMLIPGLNIFLLVGAGIAVLLGFGVIGVSSETAIAALTDQAALGDVICFMRDTLRTQSVTEAHWNACMDSYPFSVGSHQAIDADFIKATLSDNYLSVLNMLGQGYDSVLAGDDLPECPCTPPAGCTSFIGGNMGTWVPASHDDSQAQFTADGIGQENNTYLRIWGEGYTNIHSFTITFSPAWSGTDDFHKFFLNVSNLDGSNFQSTLGGGLSSGASITYTTTGANWTSFAVEIAAGGYTYPPNGSNPTAIYITEICIEPAP